MQNLQQVLAAEHPGHPRKYSICDRMKNWEIEYRRRSERKNMKDKVRYIKPYTNLIFIIICDKNVLQQLIISYNCLYSITITCHQV